MERIAPEFTTTTNLLFVLRFCVVLVVLQALNAFSVMFPPRKDPQFASSTRLEDAIGSAIASTPIPLLTRALPHVQILPTPDTVKMVQNVDIATFVNALNTRRQVTVRTSGAAFRMLSRQARRRSFETRLDLALPDR